MNLHDMFYFVLREEANKVFFDWLFLDFQLTYYFQMALFHTVIEKWCHVNQWRDDVSFFQGRQLLFSPEVRIEIVQWHND